MAEVDNNNDTNDNNATSDSKAEDENVLDTKCKAKDDSDDDNKKKTTATTKDDVDDNKDKNNNKKSNNDHDVDDITAKLAATDLLKQEEVDDKDEKDNTNDDTTSANTKVSSQRPPLPTFDHHDLDTLNTVAKMIKDGVCKKILILSGAGVSVSAGIPDFRTPGTGLYDNLAKYNLPYPEAIFDIHYYKDINPKPFIQLAKEIWPGYKFSPTLTHSFIALLDSKGLLLRNYTQNIDGLEVLATVNPDNVVECHGHFRTSTCTRCYTQYITPNDNETYVIKPIVEQGIVPICKRCKKGYIKPDIVFFGEGLPNRFHKLLNKDIYDCDLCIIMGTSLKVAPVCMIPDIILQRNYKQLKGRILFNRELVGTISPYKQPHMDHYVQGDCDDIIYKLCHLLGWENELFTLNEQTKISNKKVG